ncbi:hypothetical protein DICPUDRAFT_154042 [Dictyostelium purpureum]|uniref:Uncharacterized protein n=1 Tax=Dictyostelium purpureum TaxID=5786 RepID=F0ZQF4_DICPU|nr:uncharacterized protein DICPUDRAFT_154042 [Dictyostelium purpureum]EGC33829.1 hypothetical protein DICPUDRAFT_154042 [Dictyostelium purpureum]|eukprot:XP_003289655.1 hypothetical protein DICPUDRAFT_154042 [Dictyostelium purpureum]
MTYHDTSSDFYSPSSSSHESEEIKNNFFIRIPFLNDSVPAIWAMFALATVFVILATVLSAHLIYKHLKYYTQPDHQRYIVRIYEAMYYNMFFALCVNYGGGDKIWYTFYSTSTNEITYTVVLGFLQFCRMGMLQYVLIRPAITLASAILEVFHLYDESYSITGFYLYATIIINISVTIALYVVVLFYQSAAEELAPYKPLLKFTSIKIVVFFCFWQSVAISGMTNFGWIPTVDGWDVAEVSTGLQNFLICFEMFGVAILHIYAFPYELYRVRAFSAAPLIHRVEMGTIFNNVINSVSQKDMVKETVKSFKGTKITDGKTKQYDGLSEQVFDEFQDIEEIEMGDFKSYEHEDNFTDFELNGATPSNNKNIKNNRMNHHLNNIGSAILAGGSDPNDLITDDQFFSLMNNDYTNIDLSNLDQEALEEMIFDDDDEDMVFTARR